MEILDKKSNRMSRANSGVSERSEFPDLQQILDFLSLRNLLSNELFFTFYLFATAHFIKCVRTLVTLALVRC
ncbi:riboflavin synthase subunit alpha [Fusobacterium pseudoperiodonticum]|uniref:Riboflavin synthase subunit alpha n=1 Tax=Fusobacterium pseudoperiodonticum TaxID=2663009 RepID=A0A2D3NWY5_9FUSO|nr:riboflavin synthase subunit alpha [Fusobacterium pseudoperiodonticum]